MHGFEKRIVFYRCLDIFHAAKDPALEVICLVNNFSCIAVETLCKDDYNHINTY